MTTEDARSERLRHTSVVEAFNERESLPGRLALSSIVWTGAPLACGGPSKHAPIPQVADLREHATTHQLTNQPANQEGSIISSKNSV